MKKRPLFLLFCMFSAAPAAFAASEPASHRAVYDLFLESTKGGAGSVVDARGKMVYAVRKVCGEWKTETTFSLDVSYELSGIDTTHWKQETLESPDGCRFDFTVYTFRNGEDRTEFKGKAVCEGKAKKISISEPLASEAVFPAGVRFPVQQTLMMLDAAEKGKKSVSSYVYDGTRLEALYFMNALISPAGEAGAPENVTGDVSLLNGKSYRFDAAFFNDTGLDGEGKKDGSPFYEASVRYYENGISDDVVQDFGIYKLRSQLREIKKLSDLPCSKSDKAPLTKEGSVL